MKTLLRTDVGKVRANNEDAAFVGENLAILCDGMGGHNAGDVAANAVVDLLSVTLTNKMPSVRTLTESIAKANEKVFAKSVTNKQMSGMGTTLTALWADEDTVLIAQVGDSRAYLLRSGLLRQVTHDHSMVAELLLSGSITPEEARIHPYRNLVTRSVGTGPRVEPDIFELSRHPGDRWLLCSDGLTTHVTDAEIAVAMTAETLQEAADRMMRLALARGGVDNITLLLLCDEGGDGA